MVAEFDATNSLTDTGKLGLAFPTLISPIHEDAPDRPNDANWKQARISRRIRSASPLSSAGVAAHTARPNTSPSIRLADAEIRLNCVRRQELMACLADQVPAVSSLHALC